MSARKEIMFTEESATILAFQAKLALYKHTLGWCNFHHFANSTSVKKLKSIPELWRLSL